MDNIHFNEVCVICLDSNSSHIFKPCLHMCICDVCTEKYVERTDRTCPMCRKPYSSVEFHESPPVLPDVSVENEEKIIAKILKLSEEEALNDETLKEEEEYQISYALYESLQSAKEEVQQVNNVNKDIPKNQDQDTAALSSAKYLAYVSRGAVPKSIKFPITQISIKEITCLDVYFCFCEYARIHFHINSVGFKSKTRQHFFGTFSLCVPATKLNFDHLMNKSSDESFIFILKNPDNVINFNMSQSLINCKTSHRNPNDDEQACVSLYSDKVIEKLRDLISKNPGTRNYNFNIINYEIDMDQSPLEINVSHVFSSNSLNLQISYEYREEILSKKPLKNVKIIVHVNQLFRFIGTPNPIKIPNSSAMYWYFEEIGHTNGVGTLSIRYDFIDKTAPARVGLRVEYACDGATLTGMDLVDLDISNSVLNYSVKGVKRKIISEEYFIIDEERLGA